MFITSDGATFDDLEEAMLWQTLIWDFSSSVNSVDNDLSIIWKYYVMYGKEQLNLFLISLKGDVGIEHKFLELEIIYDVNQERFLAIMNTILNSGDNNAIYS